MPPAGRHKGFSTEPIKIEQRDYIQSLDKGLAIVRAFGPDTPTLTLSEAATVTGMTKAAARRFLLTLTHLGYLGSDKKKYWLRPKILELGERYLTSQPWWSAAQPVIEDAARKMGESCSLCILDGTEIVYVCRVAVSRFLSTNISIGSRLPAYATALGRILLAQIPPDELPKAVSKISLKKLTAKTITDKKKFMQVVNKARDDGYALVDQELEVGLTGLAVPILSSSEAFAALGVSVHPERVPKKEMLDRLLPILKESARRINMHAKRI